MTFDEWKATRVACDDIGRALNDDDTMGEAGFLYVNGTMYITGTIDGPCWTISNRDDVVGTLDECEAWLWENFAKYEVGGFRDV